MGFLNMWNAYKSAALLLAIISVSGCGSAGPQGGPRVGTVPVKGIVMVDGAPAGFLQITAVAKGGAGAVPMNSTAITAGDGSFSLSTYVSGDGVPAGEYTLTYVWGEMNLMNGQYAGDKLDGKYADPETSEFSLTIASGDMPHDLGTVNLTSQ